MAAKTKKPGRPSKKPPIIVRERYRMPKEPAGLPVWCYMEGFAPVLVKDMDEYNKLRERNWADSPAGMDK